MSLDIQPPVTDQGGKVFDIADPDLHGKLLKAGPEVSEVRFDDGAQRYVTNVHLRVVDDGLSQLNPVQPDQIIRRGQEALARLRRTWSDWIEVAEALAVGRTEVMRELHTNSPTGRRYEKAMAEWLAAHSFKTIDKGTRHRLLECLQHKTEIEAWRSRLTENERDRFNHPDTVLRKWKTTAIPKADAEPKVSPMQKLKDELVVVVEERDRMKREIESGGGDLWSADDRPQDIARVILGKLSKTKAEKVAREILNALKEAK
jgi:hypothetical protein